MDDREEIVEVERLIQSSPALQAHERRVDQEWEDAIAAVLQESERPDDAGRRRARLLAAMLMGGIRATFREWFVNDAADDLVEIGREAFDLFERGALGTGG